MKFKMLEAAMNFTERWALIHPGIVWNRVNGHLVEVGDGRLCQVLVGFVLLALYRFAPSHRQPLRALVPGTVLAAIVWTSASLIVSGAVSRVSQFGVTYGSFSAAIVLLVHLYFAAAGLLLGAELNAVMAEERNVAPSATRGADHRSDAVVRTDEVRSPTSRTKTRTRLFWKARWGCRSTTVRESSRRAM